MNKLLILVLAVAGGIACAIIASTLLPTVCIDILIALMGVWLAWKYLKPYLTAISILAVGLPVGGWACPVVFAKDADSSGPAVSERDCGANLVFTSTPTGNQARTVSSQAPAIPYISSSEPVVLKGKKDCKLQGEWTICTPATRYYFKQTCTPETCGVSPTAKTTSGPVAKLMEQAMREKK